MLINYCLVITHSINTITRRGMAMCTIPNSLIVKKKKEKKCLMSVFISDKDTAKLYVQYFRPKKPLFKPDNTLPLIL